MVQRRSLGSMATSESLSPNGALRIRIEMLTSFNDLKTLAGRPLLDAEMESDLNELLSMILNEVAWLAWGARRKCTSL
jgi:hypothetical protein